MRRSKIFNEVFGQTISDLRKQKGLSQQELADYSGLHRPQVSKIERGCSCPSIYVVFQFAECLKIRPYHLLTIFEERLSKRDT